MLIIKFELNSTFSTELSAFINNCNALIEFINNLPNYDFNQKISDYLLLKETHIDSMETVLSGIDAVKEQHDCKLRRFIFERLSAFFTRDKAIELLAASANRTFQAPEVSPAESDATTKKGYDAFDEFKNCGPFILLKANKLAMAAIIIDGLLQQIEKQGVLLKANYANYRARITNAKEQLIACMRLHLKVNDLNFQNSSRRQRELVPTELQFSMTELNPAMDKGGLVHTHTAISLPFEMSIQVLSGSGIGKATSSDLVDYFHQQYISFNHASITSAQLSKDRTLAEKTPNPLAVDAEVTAEETYTITFFKNYLADDDQEKHPVTHASYFDVVRAVGAWVYRRYYRETVQVVGNVAENKTETVIEVKGDTQSSAEPVTHQQAPVTHFFKETDPLLAPAHPQEEAAKCCKWNWCSLC